MDLDVASSQVAVTVLKHAVYPELEYVVTSWLAVVFDVSDELAPVGEDARKPALVRSGETAIAVMV